MRLPVIIINDCWEYIIELELFGRDTSIYTTAYKRYVIANELFILACHVTREHMVILRHCWVSCSFKIRVSLATYKLRCDQDKVGPLEDNTGNIITQGFFMSEELNMQFSSVFTREDKSLPVAETKFNGPEGEMLGQLIYLLRFTYYGAR